MKPLMTALFTRRRQHVTIALDVPPVHAGTSVALAW